MKEYYTIQEVALMSGLTDRTICNYIRDDILEGEKTDGVWQFTTEQVCRFFEHPSAAKSIHAVKNGQIFGFLADKWKKRPQICVILDLVGEDAPSVSTAFCERINAGHYESDLTFSLEYMNNYPRVILRGQPDEVLKLIQQAQPNL